MIIWKIRKNTKPICPWYLDQIKGLHLPAVYYWISTLENRDETSQIYDNNTYIKEYTYLGIIGGEKGRSVPHRTEK